MGIEKECYMKRLTVRMDDYTYKKIELMAKHYNKTVNAIIIELIQNGYLVKENINEEKLFNKHNSK